MSPNHDARTDYEEWLWSLSAQVALLNELLSSVIVAALPPDTIDAIVEDLDVPGPDDSPRLQRALETASDNLAEVLSQKRAALRASGKPASMGE